MIHIHLFFVVLCISLVMMAGLIIGAGWRDARAARMERELKLDIQKMSSDMTTLFLLPADLEKWLGDQLDLAVYSWNKDQREYDRGMLTGLRRLQLYLKGRV